MDLKGNRTLGKLRIRYILRYALGVLAAVCLLCGVGFALRPIEILKLLTYSRESLSGYTSHSVSVHGVSVHYLEIGPVTAPTVVLVHGLGGQAEDWLGLAPYLTRAGFHVILPEMPGYGRSEKPQNFSYSVHDEAEMIVGFMDVMGIKQTILGGWSMGGGVVQHVAFRHPERIRKLMLFDAAGLWVKPNWNVALFTPENTEQMNELRALLSPHPAPLPSFIAHDALRFSKARAWVIHRAVDSMLPGVDAPATLLPKLTMPTLGVGGTEDKLFPTDQAEKMHQLLPNSQLELIPGCGHLAPVECADAIGPKVAGFVVK